MDAGGLTARVTLWKRSTRRPVPYAGEPDPRGVGQGVGPAPPRDVGEQPRRSYDVRRMRAAYS